MILFNHLPDHAHCRKSCVAPSHVGRLHLSAPSEPANSLRMVDCISQYIELSKQLEELQAEIQRSGDQQPNAVAPRPDFDDGREGGVDGHQPSGPAVEDGNRKERDRQEGARHWRSYPLGGVVPLGLDYEGDVCSPSPELVTSRDKGRPGRSAPLSGNGLQTAVPSPEEGISDCNGEDNVDGEGGVQAPSGEGIWSNEMMIGFDYDSDDDVSELIPQEDETQAEPEEEEAPQTRGFLKGLKPRGGRSGSRGRLFKPATRVSKLVR